jgi:hypothetical protein
VTSTHPGSVLLQSRGLSAAAAEETTLQTIMVAVSGKKKRQLLQSERNCCAAVRMAYPRACQRPNQLQLSLFPNRRNLDMAGTTLSKAAASSRLRLRPALPTLHSTHEDGQSGRLPKLTVIESTLVVKCRQRNPSHLVPNRLTQHPRRHSPTGLVSARGDRRPPREPSQ